MNIKSRISESISNLQVMLSDDSSIGRITNVAELIVNAIKSGNKLMICGNGGSAADAQHIAGEFFNFTVNFLNGRSFDP